MPEHDRHTKQGARWPGNNNRGPFLVRVLYSVMSIPGQKVQVRSRVIRSGQVTVRRKDDLSLLLKECADLLMDLIFA